MSSNEPNKNRRSGKGRSNQGGGQPRRNNRNRKSNRPSDRRGGGGGGTNSRVHLTKMPRRKPKPSLWQRLLSILGLGKKEAAKATRPKSKAESERPTKSKSGTKVAKTREPRKKRKPEHVEVTSGRLYVGNLSYDATESELTELFSGVGLVSSAEVVYHSRTHRSKGFAFVEMTSKEEALRAVQELHDKDYMGRKLVVSGAKEPQTDEA